jgi:hypothetical protein
VEERLILEILSLLLQVAWADDEIASQEASHILETARDANLSEDIVDRLDKCLKGIATLPPPNLGYLRNHRDETLAAVKRLIGVDEENAEEERVLVVVRDLLQG